MWRSVDERPTFGSLFAGIGGIDLGFERAGWRGKWQVEYEPFCTRVLARHWPDVARYGDIHDVHGAGACGVPDPDSWRRMVAIDTAERIAGVAEEESSRYLRCPNCLPPVDLLAGGFPCQPFSNAGKRQGKDDVRWLWPEFARVIRELRPRYVLVENVPGLLAGHGGMGAVLGDLAALGYDAEWDSIPASAVGAPHLRYRVWIVAYATSWDCGGIGEATGRVAPGPTIDGTGWWAAEPDVGRVAHGVPARVDRLRALGNAVVPQVVEWIGRRILEAEAMT
jgi:DNA (cytosine-5)-methyltransferase 1